MAPSGKALRKVPSRKTTSEANGQFHPRQRGLRRKLVERGRFVVPPTRYDDLISCLSRGQTRQIDQGGIEGNLNQGHLGAVNAHANGRSQVWRQASCHS